jgi:hypothetical protein
VRYEVDGEFERFYLCHCQHCRKDTGSAHAANLLSSQATLKWIAGQDKVAFFNLPSTRHSKCFCSICGAALPSTQEGGKLLAVPAGSLDTVIHKKPDAHIFMSSKAGWDNYLEEIPKLERYPS